MSLFSSVRATLGSHFVPGLAAGVLALGALLTQLGGCGLGGEPASDQQYLGAADPGTCTPSAPGDCFACGDLLKTACLCKDAAGREVACTGKALDSCRADQRRSYDACVRAETCTKTVLDPALAACPPKHAPGGEACMVRAYEAYSTCLAGTNPGGGGTGPGGT